MLYVRKLCVCYFGSVLLLGFCSILYYHVWSSESMAPWGKTVHRDWECPQENTGPGSLVITAISDGRLGNQVWEYLSVWALGRRYGMRPAVPREMIKILEEFFEELSVPSLTEMGHRCELPWLRARYKAGPNILLESQLFGWLEDYEPGINLITLPYYTLYVDALVPLWREMSQELRFKVKLREAAQRKLHRVRQQVHQNLIEKQESVNLSDIEFVGVHVRRSDYMQHLKATVPGSKPAGTDFFKNAMEWMRLNLERHLAFVVTSDDLEWCRKELRGPDVIFAGTGDVDSPAEDLALLSACNHTIYAYGSYGMTAAMLATPGRFTVVFDTQNETNTKDMEIARKLPGWFALDDEGNVKETIDFKFIT